MPRPAVATVHHARTAAATSRPTTLAGRAMRSGSRDVTSSVRTWLPDCCAYARPAKTTKASSTSLNSTLPCTEEVNSARITTLATRISMIAITIAPDTQESSREVAATRSRTRATVRSPAPRRTG